MTRKIGQIAIQRNGKEVDEKEHLTYAFAREAVSFIDKHKEKPVIVVCETGARADTAATKLVKAGFQQVYLLRGGLTQWRASNLPVTKKR